MEEFDANKAVISLKCAIEFRRGKKPQEDSSASGRRWALKLFLMDG